MAITETRSLPAQFIEDLGKDYAKQLTAATSVGIDTSKFAPTVAGQDVLPAHRLHRQHEVDQSREAACGKA